jgi:hypothetical protein
MRIAIALSLIVPLGLSAQRPASATYITDAEVKTVLATPGIDHTIRVVDIGHENFAIGVIHRGASAPPSTTPAAGRANATASPCGDEVSAVPADAVSWRDHSRFADRRLLHPVWRRHAHHRRTHRQRKQIGT